MVTFIHYLTCAHSKILMRVVQTDSDGHRRTAIRRLPADVFYLSGNGVLKNNYQKNRAVEATTADWLWTVYQLNYKISSLLFPASHIYKQESIKRGTRPYAVTKTTGNTNTPGSNALMDTNHSLRLGRQPCLDGGGELSFLRKYWIRLVLIQTCFLSNWDDLECFLFSSMIFDLIDLFICTNRNCSPGYTRKRPRVSERNSLPFMILIFPTTKYFIQPLKNQRLSLPWKGRWKRYPCFWRRKKIKT